MLKITLYLGLNDQETKRQEIKTLDAYKIVSNLMAKEVGGCSIGEIEGVYQHDNGEIIHEKSLEIKLFGVTKTKANSLAQTLCGLFNQESVIVEVTQVSSDFISK